MHSTVLCYITKTVKPQDEPRRQNTKDLCLLGHQSLKRLRHETTTQLRINLGLLIFQTDYQPIILYQNLILCKFVPLDGKKWHRFRFSSCILFLSRWKKLLKHHLKHRGTLRSSSALKYSCVLSSDKSLNSQICYSSWAVFYHLTGTLNNVCCFNAGLK